MHPGNPTYNPVRSLVSSTAVHADPRWLPELKLGAKRVEPRPGPTSGFAWVRQVWPEDSRNGLVSPSRINL